MVQLKQTDETGNVIKTFTFPSSVSVYTSDVLEKITDNIKVAPHYALVGIITELTPSTILIGGKLDSSVTIVPVLAKVGDTDNVFSDNIGNVVVIDKSSLERGIHCTNSSNTSYSSLRKTINKIVPFGKRFNYNEDTLNKDAMKKPCYIIEFKLVPISDIHGCYTYDKVDDIDFTK